MFVCMFSTAHTVQRCGAAGKLSVRKHHTVRAAFLSMLADCFCRCFENRITSLFKYYMRSAKMASSRGKCDQKQARFRRVGKVNRGEIERVAPSLNQETCTNKLEHFFFCV